MFDLGMSTVVHRCFMRHLNSEAGIQARPSPGTWPTVVHNVLISGSAAAAANAEEVVPNAPSRCDLS